jgi:hypothetical protein
VSFGTYARKVRDGSLPYGRRVNALAGCVQRYQPLGYSATFGYLSHVAGAFRRDETALLRALDTLTASRRLWLAEVDAYAARRKVAKRLGWRTPRSSDTDPSLLLCWYGDSQRAAIFALGFLLRNPDQIRHADADVIRLASSVLEAGGDVSRVPLEQLSVLREQNLQLQRTSGWPNVDWPNWHKANQSLWVLHQISNATS